MESKRLQFIRKQASDTLELTKGFTPEQRATFSNELKAAEELAGYILELTNAHTGAVWVKASERLPDSWLLKCVRFIHTKQTLIDPERWLSENKSAIEVVEWLDESAGECDAVELIQYIRENYKPSKEVWKDKFGIALLSDEGVLSMYKQQKEK